MRRDQLPQHTRPTYVLPQYKAAYVAVSKAACTSLKWLVAGLNGERPEQFHRSISKMITRDMCIHQRSLWERTPTLASLSDAQLAEVHPDNGWFVFTVVRHPSARLFSAWQSKFLLREPRWVEILGDREWFPRVPASTEDVVEDFRRFAVATAADPHGRVMRDRHFMAQHPEAAIGRMPYTRVYDTPEIPQLLADFGAHLRAHGYDGPDLALRRSNETPLQPVAAVFSDEVRAAIRTLYAEDFEHLGHADVVPPKLHPDATWPAAVFDEIGRIVERHERIGDLSARAKALQEELREARRATEAAPAANGAGTGAPASAPGWRAVAGRVKRRLAP